MKMILTHKKQLKTAGDVSRFIRYCYGRDGTRPIVPVEGYMPGLPAGAPAPDGEALLSSHHGGKASKARSIAFSTQYFSTQEEALAHAPALPRVCSAYRTHWAPQSNAISIVHLTEGKKQWAGMWRLDAHLIICNSDGRRGLQWDRHQCQAMQDFAWLPAIEAPSAIVSGKGAGITRRTQKIPYPNAKNLIAYDIGQLTDEQIETNISHGLYGAARRAKDGRVISIEASGKRVNIARARELVRVKDGTGPCEGILRAGGAEASSNSEGSVSPGLLRNPAIPILEGRTGNYLGHGGERGAEGAACAVAVYGRRRRLSGRGPGQPERQTGFTELCPAMRRSAAASLARQSPTGAILKLVGNRITTPAEVLESIEIFRL